MPSPNIYMIMSEPMFDKRSAPTSPTDPNYSKPASTFGSSAMTMPGAIEVLSYNFTVNQKGSEPGGRPRSVEEVVRSEVRIKKMADSRSPKLFRYCCEGAYIASVEIQVYGPVLDKPYLTFHLSYVHISSFEPAGGGPDGFPIEMIGLTYGQMAIKFDNAGMGSKQQGNARSGSVENEWSWVMEMPVTITAGPGSTLAGSTM